MDQPPDRNRRGQAVALNPVGYLRRCGDDHVAIPVVHSDRKDECPRRRTPCMLTRSSTECATPQTGPYTSDRCHNAGAKPPPHAPRRDTARPRTEYDQAGIDASAIGRKVTLPMCFALPGDATIDDRGSARAYQAVRCGQPIECQSTPRRSGWTCMR